MKTALDDVVAQLVARFRRQRPLRGGSLIVTIFGDSIAPRGGAIALGSLIRLCEPFGLTDRLVRTSVGRLSAEHWLVGTRQGRGIVLAFLSPRLDLAGTRSASPAR